MPLVQPAHRLDWAPMTALAMRRRGTRLWAAVALALSVATMLSPRSVHADREQTPSGETAEVDPQWRLMFDQARAAYADKRLAEAKSLFVKAGLLRMTPKILSNLAQVELELGEYRAAAKHTAQALASFDASVPAAKQREVEENLRQARQHVGALVLDVTVVGAAVAVDGDNVGVTPLDLPIFVEPGQRRIAVSKAGHVTAERDLVVQAGAELRLRMELAPALPSASASPSPPSAARAAPLPPPSAPPPASRSSLGRRGWLGRPSPAVLVAGGALVAGGLVTGLVLDHQAHSHYDHADELRERIGTSGCYGALSTHSDCALLLESLRDGDRARNVSTAGSVVAGAALVGTALYWFWPRPTASSSRPGQQSLYRRKSLHPTALVGKGSFALTVRSSF